MTWLYGLRMKYLTTLQQSGLSNYGDAERASNAMVPTCEFGGMVLDLIDKAAAKEEISLSIWRWYAVICKQWPVHNNRLHVAEAKLV